MTKSHNTIWYAFQRNSPYLIPTDFVEWLLKGHGEGIDLSWLDANPFDHEVREDFEKRLSKGFANSHLTISADGGALALADSLASIIWHHDSQLICKGDLCGVCLAHIVANMFCDWGDPLHTMITAYLSGHGVCMHVASFGVAIARISGVRAEVVGNAHYYPFWEVGQHYAVALGKNREVVMPRGRLWWRSNRCLRPMSEVSIEQYFENPTPAWRMHIRAE